MLGSSSNDPSSNNGSLQGADIDEGTRIITELPPGMHARTQAHKHAPGGPEMQVCGQVRSAGSVRGTPRDVGTGGSLR